MINGGHLILSFLWRFHHTKLSFYSLGIW